MCMSEVTFKPVWSNDLGCYIFHGWKAFQPKIECRVNRWLKADGNFGYQDGSKDLVSNVNMIPDCGNVFLNKDYPAGFHILLSYEDAAKYHAHCPNIRRVAFTDVLAFGKNKLYNVKSEEHAPCVIAAYMYVFNKRESEKYVFNIN